MSEQQCSVTLHEKIAARSGRLQLLVAELGTIARAFRELPCPTTDKEYASMEQKLMPLIQMADDYGPQWLDECAMLLKELYNRREGP